MSDLVRCRFCDRCFRKELRRFLCLILRLVCSGVTERTIGKRVFPCPCHCISWSIVELIDVLVLVCFKMYSCYVIVILVLVFSVA